MCDGHEFFLFFIFYANEIVRFDGLNFVVGLAYQGNNIVFRFILEYSSLRDFGP